MIFDSDNRETLELARQNPYRPTLDDPASPGELFSAADRFGVSENQSISQMRWLRPYVKARDERIQAITGGKVDPLLTAVYGFDSSAQDKLGGFIDAGEIRVGRMTGDAAQSTDWITTGLPLEVEFESDRARKWAQKNRDSFRALLYIRALKEQDPEILTDDEILEQIAAQAKEVREETGAVLSRASGFLGHTAAFAGAAWAAVKDPPIALTLPLGGAAIRGPKIGWNAAKAFGIEAGIATAIEVPVQANVFAFKREIESPWSAGQAAFTVLAAAVGAGTIRASASTIIDVSQVVRRGMPMRLIEAERIIGEQLSEPMNAAAARRMLDNYRTGVEAGNIEVTPASEVARIQLERFVHIADENRLGPDRIETHFDRVEAAADDIVATRQTDAIVGPEEVPVLGGRMPERYESLPLMDPDDLLVDAARFQFKHGADDLGVTDRLRGVTTFDRLRAGVIVVYEDLAGRFFIVDGHQRLALARRARAAGQAPEETRLPAHILREADGVTPGEARTNAALKNISEGTGTAIDAAKVIREIRIAGGDIARLNLPPNAALTRQAHGLAKLDDEAFQQVINEVIPEAYAAIVGERILDPRQQAAVIKLLARTDPANANQARIIVEQARAAGFETRTTEDLFGEVTVSESYYIERAKVLDAAMRRLRQDRGAFKTVVSRGTTLEEAGNVLNTEANTARLASDDALLTIINAQANQRGPVSDALNAAARRVRDGAKPSEVTDDLLGAIRAERLSESSPGAPARGARSPEQIKAQEKIEEMFREGEAFAAAAGIDPPVRALPDDHPLLIPQDSVKTPERLALRESLIDERFEGAIPVAEGEQKIAYVMGGGGASGKGTVKGALIKEGEIPKGAVHLDPDEFKTGAASAHDEARLMRGIPEYDEIVGAGDSRAAMVSHEESSALYKAALKRARGKYHLVLDRTLGNGQKSLDELQGLIEAGYEVRLVGVSLDTEEAFIRAIIRAQGPEKRYVPLRMMIEAHQAFAEFWDRLVAIASSARLYDNNVARNAAPIKAAEKKLGGTLQIVDEPLYNRFVRKGTEEINLEQAARNAADRQRQSDQAGLQRGNDAVGQGEAGQRAGAPRGEEPEGRPGDLPDLLAGRAAETDLFGPAPVREQALADANRAVDERLGAGREAVPAESRGDLFDLNRERQIDLTDARIQRVAEERGLDMPTLERAELEELDRFLREEGQLIEIPDRIELDADGNPAVIGRRANEVFSELDGQARALDAIELCTVGSAA